MPKLTINSTVGLTSVPYTNIDTDVWNTEGTWIDNSKCRCCNRVMGLPRGSRGLCDACDEDIPNHIPEEQYVKYMKEYWRKK